MFDARRLLDQDLEALPPETHIEFPNLAPQTPLSGGRGQLVTDTLSGSVQGMLARHIRARNSAGETAGTVLNPDPALAAPLGGAVKAELQG